MAFAPESKWYKIAEDEQALKLGKNSIGIIEVIGKKVCLTKFENNWYAFAYKCPHASGIMANGYIDASGNIVCPVHFYKFNIKNGRSIGNEGLFLKIFPIQVSIEGVFIKI